MLSTSALWSAIKLLLLDRRRRCVSCVEAIPYGLCLRKIGVRSFKLNERKELRELVGAEFGTDAREVLALFKNASHNP